MAQPPGASNWEEPLLSGHTGNRREQLAEREKLQPSAEKLSLPQQSAERELEE